MTDFNSVNVSVVGLGISNMPLLYWLLEKGANITARDKKNKEDIPRFEELESKGVKFVCGEDYLENITDDVIFRSPGIRPDIVQFREAVSRGALLTSEMELFFELCPAHILGITGSDGKTTTTTICSLLLEKQFGKVFLGGNIGSPLLPRVDEMTKDDWAVVELSSFQLMDMRRSPEIAIITNISPNHLNWHKDMEEYVRAKKNIFLNPTCRKVALNFSNEITRKCASEVPILTEVVSFCGNDFIHCDNGIIYYYDKEIMRISDIKLPGEHNVQNYMAACAALYDIVDFDIIKETARTFGGVPHRLQLIREKDGVKYYNSSIDSSPTRTAAALSSFNDKNTIIILGGYDKNIPFAPLAKPLCEKVKHIVLTGATAEKIEKEIKETDYAPALPPISREDDFDKAVMLASTFAENGDRVLLSPACASFDAFPNFEKRGERFSEIVDKL